MAGDKPFIVNNAQGKTPKVLKLVINTRKNRELDLK